MTTYQESSLRLVREVAAPSPHSPSGLEFPLPSPAELRGQLPLVGTCNAQIQVQRAHLKARIEHGIGAPIAIVGPCSIHCEASAIEYAQKLRELQSRLGERVQIVMRVYFEKPRTTLGWKGFLYDPDVDGSHDLRRGLERARALLVQIAEIGLPIATEILDPLVAEYFEDCLSWVAIGARTSESQIHRQLASGLACPVGFKNGTDGSVTVAAQASQTAEQAHTHLGINEHGKVVMKQTRGNPATHVVLRGGKNGPNYHVESVTDVARSLRALGRRAAVVVDCSHGNSEKDYARQPLVAREVMAQMRKDHADVMGLMLESHLKAGSQPAAGAREYGVSITDGCVDFETTEHLLEELAHV
jgi:3-deoxy-7-phosphoheptulonate synthase